MQANLTYNHTIMCIISNARTTVPHRDHDQDSPARTETETAFSIMPISIPRVMLLEPKERHKRMQESQPNKIPRQHPPLPRDTRELRTSGIALNPQR